MNDQDILQHIGRLVDEEHGLLQKSEEERGLSQAEHARVRQLELSLDQLWDLLRQRRARSEAGLDPDAARLRDPEIVEGYTA